MSLTKPTSIFLAFLVTAVLLVGCGKSDNDTTDPETAELGQIYEVYTSYEKVNQKPPSKLSDILKKETEIAFPDAVRTLKEGKYVVVFGVEDKDSSTVLAYEKNAPKEGGSVLMADGKVKKMSADEFNAAYKLGK